MRILVFGSPGWNKMKMQCKIQLSMKGSKLVPKNSGWIQKTRTLLPDRFSHDSSLEKCALFQATEKISGAPGYAFSFMLLIVVRRKLLHLLSLSWWNR